MQWSKTFNCGSEWWARREPDLNYQPFQQQLPTIKRVFLLIH